MISFKMFQKLLFVTLFFSVLTSEVSAQISVIKGKILSSSMNGPLREASISVLRQKDSVLLASTRSNNDGAFVFNHAGKGNYILLVTYPDYADYTENFNLDSLSEIKVFDVVTLTPKSVLLNEVIIRAKRAVTFKGDTTEFDVGSFRIKPDASVEEMLKQLPGLNVDNKGNISAYGKRVDRVLVDGEEFFGDDPTLITKNLKADIVDKVQLYDKKSDQAAFSGVDDGHKSLTIDLKIKKEKKQGHFGKIETGLGNRKFYENQALYNNFRGNEKIAAFVNLSNTGKVGLDSKSQRDFADGRENPIQNELDSWDGTYQGAGIPRSFSGGLHYNNKWDNDRQSINANYKLGDLQVTGESNTIIQNNIPDAPLYSTLDSKNKNQIFRQGLSVFYSKKIDSTSELKLSLQGSLVNKKTDQIDIAETKDGTFAVINNNYSQDLTKDKANLFVGNLLWQKKFNKERRTISLNFNTSIRENNSTGNFYATSNFLSISNKVDSSQTFDQFKRASNSSMAYELKLIYTEPLSKQSSLIGNYGLAVQNAKAELGTFNRSPNGDFSNTLDSLYSNDYQFDQFFHKGGLAYVYKSKKLRIQIGSDVESNKFTQRNLFNGSTLTRAFTNWYPKTLMVYNISSSRSLTFNYQGNTTQPAIHQLQPIIDNRDPLNIFVGNTLLRPMFSNSFSTSYQLFKGSKYIDIRGDYSMIHDPITISTETNKVTGKTVNTYVNLNSESTSTYSANFLYRNKIKNWSLDYGADGGFIGAKYAGITNGTLNVTNSNTYQFNLVISKSIDSIYYIGTSLGTNYNVNSNSLQPSLSNNSWGYSVNPYVSFFFRGKLQIHTDGNYTWQGRTQTFNDDFSRFIWNISIEKRILKKEDFLLKLSANDILNQNIGFNRKSYANLITQNRYTTIGRYFMVSLVWNFNKIGDNIE